MKTKYVKFRNNKGETMELPASLKLGDFPKFGMRFVAIVHPDMKLRKDEWISVEPESATRRKAKRP